MVPNITPNAMIRHITIDECLHKKRYGCTFKELQDACTEALVSNKGRNPFKPISPRTLFNDLKIMRELYNAPIELNNNKKYYYTNLDFYLNKQKVPEDLDLLKQIRDFILKKNEIGTNSTALSLASRLSILIESLDSTEIKYRRTMENRGLLGFQVNNDIYQEGLREKRKRLPSVRMGEIFSVLGM